MIFTPAQVEEILGVMDYHYSFVIGKSLGFDSLTDEERDNLKRHGVDVESYKGKPIYDKMYLFGKLSAALGKQTDTIDYDDFKKFVERGQYQPLTDHEKMELKFAKKKTYTHLKGLKSKSLDYLRGRMTEAEHTAYREKYEGTVKDAIERGVAERKSVSEIVSDLGHKTGEWRHDWGRIVETEMNDVFQQARLQGIIDKYGPDAMVMKTVFPGACKHCIRLYLTGGIGSEPKQFKASELLANGTNIGRKTFEWKPVVGSTHPFCRCHIVYVPPGYVWDEEKGMFVIGKFERKVERKSKIKITIGDKVRYV